jgi:hypothetical protein
MLEKISVARKADDVQLQDNGTMPFMDVMDEDLHFMPDAISTENCGLLDFAFTLWCACLRQIR